MKMKWVSVGVSLLVLLVFVSVGPAAGKMRMMDSGEKIILTPDELVWKDGPAAVPGSKMAVLDGDPGKKGFFVARIKLPAGAKIPSHMHMRRERVTVISGKFNLAMGDKPENPVVLPAGSYFSLPPAVVHNAWVDEETVVQISTAGPWTFKVVGKGAGRK